MCLSEYFSINQSFVVDVQLQINSSSGCMNYSGLTLPASKECGTCSHLQCTTNTSAASNCSVGVPTMDGNDYGSVGCNCLSTWNNITSKRSCEQVRIRGLGVWGGVYQADSSSGVALSYYLVNRSTQTLQFHHGKQLWLIKSDDESLIRAAGVGPEYALSWHTSSCKQYSATR
jgi:hypothetical protein